MLKADALNQLRQLKSEIKSSKDLHQGRVKVAAARFGFVTLDDERDIYLPQEQAERVFPGDRVEVCLLQGADGKPYGELEKLHESPLNEFVGRYQVRGKGHFVVADHPGLGRWLFVPPQQRAGASEGDLVRCRVFRHPFRNGKAQAEILAVIGSPGEPGIERAYMLEKYGLEDQWPEAVIQETEKLDPSAIDRQADNREDLRGQPLVTIDSAGTRDMDDALAARKESEGWTLTVAIADPAALLASGGPTEACARRRTSAAYFPGQVRPMLPERLSEALGSLWPDADRLALACEVRVLEDGTLGDYRLFKAVIRSGAKLSYNGVTQWLETGDEPDIQALAEPYRDSLNQLKAVADALRGWRREHALVGEERPDYRLRLNSEGRVERIDRVWPTIAHRMVEESMIAANRCAADFLIQRGEPGLFITHRGVRPEKQTNVQSLLEDHGQDLAGNDPMSPEGFAAILREGRADPEALPIGSIMMRQLARAELAHDAAPHQGMGLAAYTTFTSPLRKYTDFYVHRLIHHALDGEPFEPLTEPQLRELEQGQQQLRQAVNEAERWLKLDYLPKLAGEDLEGRIVHVLSAGFQVRLDETGIEGFVAMRDLGEKFRFDPVTMTLASDSRQFQLDQPVLVRFDSIDTERQQARFRFLDVLRPPPEA